MKGKYCLIDMYEDTYVIAKNIALNTLKSEARKYHWETDGECMLAYIKADTDGKYHLKDRRPVYTFWDETENGNTTVYVELQEVRK